MSVFYSVFFQRVACSNCGHYLHTQPTDIYERICIAFLYCCGDRREYHICRGWVHASDTATRIKIGRKHVCKDIGSQLL